MADKRGISPAELLSVVSLISLLLLAVSVRALGDRGGKVAVDVLDQVSVLLQLARVEAVTRGDTCSLEIDPSGLSRVVDGRSGKTIHLARIDAGYRLAQTDPEGHLASAPRVEVVFDAAGHPSEGKTGLWVRSDQLNGAVWVDDGGEIFVDDFREKKGSKNGDSSILR